MEVGCPVFLDPTPDCCHGCSLAAPEDLDREADPWVELRRTCLRQLTTWVGFAEPWHPSHEANLWRRLALHLQRGFPLTPTEGSLLTLVLERAERGREELLAAPFWDTEGETSGGLDWLLAVAAVAFGVGRSEQALTWAQEARRIAPRDVEVGATLGTILHRAGRWAEAEELYATILAERPDASKVLYNRAKLRFQLEEYPGARRDLEAAIVHDPYSPQAWNDLGVVVRRLAEDGADDEALAAFNEALNLDPGYAPAWHNKGLLHEDRAELTLAVRAYQKALQARPDFTPAQEGLSRCLPD